MMQWGLEAKMIRVLGKLRNRKDWVVVVWYQVFGCWMVGTTGVKVVRVLGTG